MPPPTITMGFPLVRSATQYILPPELAGDGGDAPLAVRNENCLHANDGAADQGTDQGCHGCGASARAAIVSSSPRPGRECTAGNPGDIDGLRMVAVDGDIERPGAARPLRDGADLADSPPTTRTHRARGGFSRRARHRDRVRSCPPSRACRRRARSAGTRCPSDRLPAVRGA